MDQRVKTQKKKKMIDFILANVSKVLLICMGWKSPSKQTVEYIEEVDTNQVLLTQHTSKWDFVFSLLYSWSLGLGSRFKYIMTESMRTKFWYLQPLFYATGCIFVPRIEGRNQGSTQGIIDAINADPTKRKIILISPNGSTKGSLNQQWRSGWFYIAKGINAQVGTLGVNYHPLVRSMEYNAPRPLLNSLEESEATFKAEISAIYPKFPKESSVLPLTSPLQDQEDQPAIDLVLLSSLVGFTLLPMWLSTETDMFFISLLSGICSARYHFEYEQNKLWTVIDARVALFTILYFQVKLISKFWGHPVILALNALNLWAVSWLYKKGCGRERCLYRAKTYTWTHSLFHCMGLINMLIYERYFF